MNITDLEVVESRPINALVETAANWWANKLRAIPHALEPTAELPRVSTAVRATNIPSLNVYLDGATLSPTLIDYYEHQLGYRIQAMLDAGDETDYSIGEALYVDRKPSQLHVYALRAAGLPISMTILPWKTRMAITQALGEVHVADGYGAPFRQLYPRADPTPAEALRQARGGHERYIRSLRSNPQDHSPQEV